VQQGTHEQAIVGQPGTVVAPNPMGDPRTAIGNQIDGVTNNDGD
jgi:hypothetical protein